jgi:peptide-methionine (R)-S-oxide reductase
MAGLFAMLWGVTACADTAGADDGADGKDVELVIEPQRDDQGKLIAVEKTPEQWEAELSEKEFYILRQSGTERAGTGRYLDHKEDGVYACAGCGLVLFDSKTKFNSGTGWPSFYDRVDPDFVDNLEDRSHGMVRVENRCARCGGHLGHVFNDGPPPTGMRYCINGYALDFVEREEVERLKNEAAESESQAAADAE